MKLTNKSCFSKIYSLSYAHININLKTLLIFLLFFCKNSKTDLSQTWSIEYTLTKIFYNNENMINIKTIIKISQENNVQQNRLYWNG